MFSYLFWRLTVLAVGMWFVLVLASAQTPPQSQKYPVLLVTNCDDPVGSVVASSLRESFRASNGYILVDKEVNGIFSAQLMCIEDGNGRSAMAFTFFLVVKTDPDVGNAAWGLKTELSTVNREHAMDKGRELFSRFDNWLHEHR